MVEMMAESKVYELVAKLAENLDHMKVATKVGTLADTWAASLVTKWVVWMGLMKVVTKAGR